MESIYKALFGGDIPKAHSSEGDTIAMRDCLLHPSMYSKDDLYLNIVKLAKASIHIWNPRKRSRDVDVNISPPSKRRRVSNDMDTTE